MTKSTYSRPPSSQTRQPDARVMRAGVPKSASGRLLPVDVKPGTRQSLTVFHHLDGHRPQQLRLALIERRAVNHFPHGPHDAFDLTRLEELDAAERRLGVREQSLQVAHRRRRAL